MKRPHLKDTHGWSQRHLSEYVDGDLGWIARRRLELHAEDCPDCSRGIKAIRALIHLMAGSQAEPVHPAPATIFDLVRAEANEARTDMGSTERS